MLQTRLWITAFITGVMVLGRGVVWDITLIEALIIAGSTSLAADVALDVSERLHRPRHHVDK
jgi:hypothetical protein